MLCVKKGTQTFSNYTFRSLVELWGILETLPKHPEKDKIFGDGLDRIVLTLNEVIFHSKEIEFSIFGRRLASFTYELYLYHR